MTRPLISDSHSFLTSVRSSPEQVDLSPMPTPRPVPIDQVSWTVRRVNESWTIPFPIEFRKAAFDKDFWENPLGKLTAAIEQPANDRADIAADSPAIHVLPALPPSGSDVPLEAQTNRRVVIEAQPRSAVKRPTRSTRTPSTIDTRKGAPVRAKVEPVPKKPTITRQAPKQPKTIPVPQKPKSPPKPIVQKAIPVAAAKKEVSRVVSAPHAGAGQRQSERAQAATDKFLQRQAAARAKKAILARL